MEKPCENPILVSTGTSVGGKLHRIIITATFTITERMPGASAKAGQGGGKDRPEGVLRVTRARTYWAAHARAHGQACDCNSWTLQGDTSVVVPPASKAAKTTVAPGKAKSEPVCMSACACMHLCLVCIFVYGSVGVHARAYAAPAEAGTGRENRQKSARRGKDHRSSLMPNVALQTPPLSIHFPRTGIRDEKSSSSSSSSRSGGGSSIRCDGCRAARVAGLGFEV